MLSPADTTTDPEPFTGAFGIIQSQPDERTSIVALEGELDLGRAPSLKWALVDSLDAGCKQLVIDLSRVRFMDSTALSVLVGVNRNLNSGARMAIVCVNTNELSGMDGAFAIYPTVDEALAHVRGSTTRIG